MKNKFNKYRYLGAVYPETTEFWKPAILDMLKDIDKCIRPWHMPIWVLNTIHDITYKGNRGSNWYWTRVLESFTSKVYISQIKSKFATLRVYGIFSDEVREIVKKAEEICDNTCEMCGNLNTSHVMIKGWVTNLCETCKETYKNGFNI